MRCLHGERHTNAKRRQRDHRRRAHTDEHHLSKDRCDFEKLSGKRRDQNPIEQADIKLKIVFQNAVMRTRRMARRVDRRKRKVWRLEGRPTWDRERPGGLSTLYAV